MGAAVSETGRIARLLEQTFGGLLRAVGAGCPEPIGRWRVGSRGSTTPPPRHDDILERQPPVVSGPLYVTLHGTIQHGVYARRPDRPVEEGEPAVKPLTRLPWLRRRQRCYWRILSRPGSAVTIAPASSSAPFPGDEERFYSLATDDTAGVRQAGEDVFRLQPRIALKYGLVIIAGRQHSQYVLDGQAATSNNRFAAVHPRVGADSLKELRFVHYRLSQVSGAGVSVSTERGAFDRQRAA